MGGMSSEVFGAFFDDFYDNVPQPFAMSWPDLVALLSEHHVRADKDGPLFSMARYRPVEERELATLNAERARRNAEKQKKGARQMPMLQAGDFVRAKTHVTEMSGVVLDFDAWPAGTSGKTLLDKLSGIRAIAYTSWSHLATQDAEGQPIEKWRAVIPFEHAVPAHHYKAVWQYVANWALPLACDDAPKSVASIFYAPSCPEQRASDARSVAFDGPCFALPPLGEFKKGVPAKIASTPVVDWRWLKEKLKQHRNDELRFAFKAALKGEPFARHGSRNTLLSRMCGVLAGMQPVSDPADLASIFDQSLAAMAAEDPMDPPPSVEDTAEMIARAQSSLAAEREIVAREVGEEAERERAEAAQRQLDAQRPAPPKPPKEPKPKRQPVVGLPGDGGDVVKEPDINPEDERDWDDFARACSFDDGDELLRHLILAKGDAFWVWKGREGWQGPMKEKAADLCLQQFWADVPGARLFRVKADGGLTRRTFARIFDSHGKTLSDYAVDLSPRRRGLDKDTLEYIHAGVRWRPLEPQYSAIVDRWLRALGGERAEKLLDWVACCPDLEWPCAALFFRGDASVGKSLLVRGLARLWMTDKATRAVSIAENFNSELTKCPLVALEEGKWKKGVDATSFLRELVTAPSRAINEKYLPFFELRGYVRVIITANNFNIFAADEHGLTPQDRDALALRFVEITPSQEAADILEELSIKDRDALAADDVIARHALWLAENRQVKPGRRLLVEGDKSDAFATNVVVHDKKWGSWVMEWLAKWLTHPGKVENHGERGLVWRGEGRAVVNPEAIVSSWERLVAKGAARPTALDVSNALKSLSTGTPVAIPGAEDAEGFDVRIEDVVRFAKETLIGVPQRIEQNAWAPAGPAPRVVVPIDEARK